MKQPQPTPQGYHNENEPVIFCVKCQADDYVGCDCLCEDCGATPTAGCTCDESDF